MAGFKGDIRFGITGTFTGANDIATPKQKVDVSKILSLVAGTAAVNEANLLFSDTRTIAASSNEDIDLAGSLSDAFGSTLTAAEILAIYIAAASGNTNNVVFGPAASNGFTGPFGDASDRLSVKPGEWQSLISGTGWAVTAGTGDLLNIANSSSGSGVTYDLVIIGRSTAS